MLDGASVGVLVLATATAGIALWPGLVTGGTTTAVAAMFAGVIAGQAAVAQRVPVRVGLLAVAVAAWGAMAAWLGMLVAAR